MKVKCGVSLLLLSLFIVQSVFGIAGVGVHYGIDMSLSMDDAIGEQTVFDKLQINVNSIDGSSSLIPATMTTISGKMIPIIINRSNFTRTWLDLGGKLYVDIIPFVDAVEASANFGAWQYKGSLEYPTSIRFIPPKVDDINKVRSASDIVEANYDTLDLTLKSSGVSFLGLEQTPYVKLNLDFTVRKYLLKLPPVVNILKIYAGGGMSINFTTPVLSSGLIEDALDTLLNQNLDDNQIGPQIFANPQNKCAEKIVKEIINRLMTPHPGMHIMVGASVKPPVVPLGLYIDAKFMIPFGSLDKNVDVGGTGLLINGGLTFGL